MEDGRKIFSGFVDRKHPVTWKIFAFQKRMYKELEEIQEYKIITCILDMRWKKESKSIRLLPVSYIWDGRKKLTQIILQQNKNNR